MARWRGGRTVGDTILQRLETPSFPARLGVARSTWMSCRTKEDKECERLCTLQSTCRLMRSPVAWRGHLSSLGLSAAQRKWAASMLSRFSHAQLFVAPRSVASQAPLSTVFSRQEYWNGLPFPSPRDLPGPGIEPASSALAGGFFTTSTTWATGP